MEDGGNANNGLVEGTAWGGGRCGAVTPVSNPLLEKAWQMSWKMWAVKPAQPTPRKGKAGVVEDMGGNTCTHTLQRKARLGGGRCGRSNLPNPLPGKAKQGS